MLAPHGAEPLTRRDLLWLIRKPGHGHLPVPDEPVTRRRPWRGGFFELAASLRGHNGGGGYVELSQRNPHTGQDQTSYTATLVVADEPPRQVFNARRAWSKKLARLAVPAEISWRYSLIPPKQWKRLADRAVDNVEDETKDRAKAGADPDDSFEARRDQAAQIRADNADDDLQPGMVGRLRLTVSAPTPAALARAIKDVKAAMGDVSMEVPAHAALPLLLEQFPGRPSEPISGRCPRARPVALACGRGTRICTNRRWACSGPTTRSATASKPNEAAHWDGSASPSGT